MKTIAISCVDTAYYDRTQRALTKTLETMRDQNCTKVYWFSDIACPYELDVPVHGYPYLKFQTKTLRLLIQ